MNRPRCAGAWLDGEFLGIKKTLTRENLNFSKKNVHFLKILTESLKNLRNRINNFEKNAFKI